MMNPSNYSLPRPQKNDTKQSQSKSCRGARCKLYVHKRDDVSRMSGGSCAAFKRYSVNLEMPIRENNLN